MSSYVEGKDKNTILGEMYTTAKPGSVVHEQQKSAILVRCVEDLEKVINNASKSATILSKKVYYLNIILTIATVIGAIATAIIAYKTFFP